MENFSVEYNKYIEKYNINNILTNSINHKKILENNMNILAK